MNTFRKISCTGFSILILSAVMTSALLSTLVATPLLAQSEPAQETLTTSIEGRVLLPEEMPEGVNVEGISIDKSIITLQGKYKHPRRPYPKNWRDLTREERGQWSLEFKNSEAYEEYQRKVEEAKATRLVLNAEIAEDGSFSFENIKPSWYQLTVMIMHPNAKDQSSSQLARGHALTQFIIKDAEQPHRLGDLTLKLKNVLMPGDTAPDWTATNYDGTVFKLSDFRGQYVLFDFWATWCGPCKAEFPNLKAVYEDFGGERFEMIGLSIDKTIDLPVEYHEKNPSTYPQGFVEPEIYQQVRNDYGIRSIPSIWLIGPDGKIVARDLRDKALREAVRTALETPTKHD